MQHTNLPPLPEPHQGQQQPHQDRHQGYRTHSNSLAQTPPNRDARPASPSSDQQENEVPKSEPLADNDDDGGHNSKPNRLPKACDSCSLRKVKCDAKQPCRACKKLDIPCTFQRPTRRRGPPNRLAESIKRAHRDSHRLSSSPYATPSPIRSNYDTPPSTSSHPVLSIESICPIELVQLLLDDYFFYVHPIQPFPHEPSYRKAFAERKDLHDRPFLALTAAMIGSLVALFPRRPRKRLESLGRENLFPSSVDFVKHCQTIISEARGPGYLEQPDLNAYDAATSYCLLSMCMSTLNWQHGILYLGECFNIVRYLLSRSDDTPQTLPGLASGSEGSDQAGSVDFIEREMKRRVYWIVFVTLRSSKPFGATIGDFHIRAPTLSNKYPPLPTEVDDQYIHTTYLESQPRNVLSKMTGFNINCYIYMTHDPLVALEDSYSINHVFDWERQKSILRDCVDHVKHCFDGLSDHLLVWPGPPSRSPSSVDATLRGQAKSSPSTPAGEQQDTSNSQHFAAYEIQKANIHASYLSSRSYFIEKYWDLVAARGMDRVTEADIRKERESIAHDLLNVLSSIRPVHMEPNSLSLVMKIRQIASTLLPSPRSSQTVDGEATTLSAGGKSEYYLRSFLAILLELDKYSRAAYASSSNTGGQRTGDSAEAEDEYDEEESRTWASLREHQWDFINRGGSESSN